jgi:carboxy-cis,cis-muconate cyclase
MQFHLTMLKDNYLDVYRILPDSLEFVSSASILPSELEAFSDRFRGDTLMLTPSTPSEPSPLALFATTRGARAETNGWLTAFELDAEGLLVNSTDRFETPTSGGKANAIDVRSKEPEPGVWILLTDDTTVGPGLRVIEWNGKSQGGFNVVAAWPSDNDIKVMGGGSHAIWL